MAEILPAGVRWPRFLWVFSLLFFAAYFSMVMVQSPYPVGGDFWQFWAAGRLVVEGQGAGAYSPSLLSASMAALADSATLFTPFYYPPPALFLLWPLGMLPYLPALVFFLLGSFLLLASAVWVWTRDVRCLLMLLGFSAVLLNIPFGQNGLLVAGLLGWAFWFLPRQPVLAGVLIGLLSFKPQFGLLWPLLLLLERRWLVLVVAALTVGVLAGLSWLCFGAEAWRGFLANIVQPELLTPWREGMMSSLLPFLLVWRVDFVWAQALQIAFSLSVVGVMAWQWHRVRPEARLALFAAASLAVAPFAYLYDMVLLFWAFLWLQAVSFPRLLSGVRWIVLGMLFFLPGLVYTTRDLLGFSPGFPLLIMALTLLLASLRSSESTLPSVRPLG